MPGTLTQTNQSGATGQSAVDEKVAGSYKRQEIESKETKK